MSNFYPTREVNTNVWERLIDSGLGTNEKLFYIYALTNEYAPKPFYSHEIEDYVLYYKFSVRRAARELGFSIEMTNSILKIFNETVEENGLLSYDEETNIIELF